MKKTGAPRERHAGVYELKAGGPLLVRGYSRAVSNWLTQWGRHRRVANEPGELGKVVLNVLAECRQGVPDTNDTLTRDDRALLRQVGATTFAAFHAKVRSVAVDDDGECIRVVPSVAKYGGTLHKTRGTVKVALPTTPAKLGDAIRRGLNRSTFLDGSRNCVAAAVTPGRSREKRRATSNHSSHPQPFGYKCAWLAIKGTASSKVLSALRLGHARSTSWKDGIDATYKLDLTRRRVFVSPEVAGWVFVVGPTGLPADERSVDLAVRLSAELRTTVHYFVTHRGVELHGWILAAKGKLLRAYAYSSGSVLFDRGKPTDVERLMNAERLEAPNEDTVMSIADAWGINPMTLGDIQQGGEGYGRLGELPLAALRYFLRTST